MSTLKEKESEIDLLIKIALASKKNVLDLTEDDTFLKVKEEKSECKFSSLKALDSTENVLSLMQKDDFDEKMIMLRRKTLLLKNWITFAENCENGYYAVKSNITDRSGCLYENLGRYAQSDLMLISHKIECEMSEAYKLISLYKYALDDTNFSAVNFDTAMKMLNIQNSIKQMFERTDIEHTFKKKDYITLIPRLSFKSKCID